MTSVWAAIVVLGGLIFAHELGHFILARLCGVEVQKFSLGFGPRLFGFQRGPTEYRVSVVPLGGYVKMVGEGVDEEVPPEKIPVSFSHKPVSNRLMIVAAGPVANFVLAFIVFTMILFFYGSPVLLPRVGEVLKDYPAEAAGLLKGDTILAIDGEPVETWTDMAGKIRRQGSAPIELTVERGRQVLNLVMTPVMGQAQDVFGQPVSKPMVGISPSGQSFTRRVSFIGAIKGGAAQTWHVARLTVVSVGKIIQRQIPVSTIGGPIFIAQLAGEQAKEGAVNLFFFIALLSVNLGLINFLPIPALDGGHIIFFSIEAIFRRPVSLSIRERTTQVGLALILLLMGVVMFNDVARIFGQVAQ